MDCTITGSSRSERAFTLMEIMVALGLAMVTLALVYLFSLYSYRSFAAISNYVALDRQSRSALDTISKEIRQAANAVTTSTATVDGQTVTNGITLVGVQADGVGTYTVAYVFNPADGTLTRAQDGGSPTILLSDCIYLNFGLFQRNPTTNYGQMVPVLTADRCKVVQMTWICRRSVLDRIFNSENVQSAQVVIRKK